MTAERRYQLESAAFTAAVLLGVVWLVGERMVRKVKGLR